MLLDETWAKLARAHAKRSLVGWAAEGSTNMARRYGRAPRGERLRAGVPHGHWKTTTFVAGLRTSGIVASFVIDGSVNRDAFETCVAKVLVPEISLGDAVVRDNLSSHKGPRVRDMIEAADASLRYLPPYSPARPTPACFAGRGPCLAPPDLNPIENAVTKLKALLRKTAARTVPSLWNAIGRLIDTVTPTECAAAGYDAT